MTERDDQPRRSARTWGALLLVWSIGLIVWAIYLVAIVYAFFRIFGPQAR